MGTGDESKASRLRADVLAALDREPGGLTAWQIAGALGFDPKRDATRLRAIYSVISVAEREGAVERKVVRSESFSPFHGGKKSVFFLVSHAPEDTEQKIRTRLFAALLPARSSTPSGTPTG
ncbi:hypothetical protein WMF38_57410 [Sorangium sp. So ce118]